MRLRIERRNLGCRPLHVVLCLREGDSRFDPGVAEEHAEPPAFSLPQRIERNPDITLHAVRARSWNRQAERRRHDARDGEGSAVQGEQLANDVCRRPELSPERRRDHDTLIVGEPPANDRIDAEVVGQRRCDRGADDVPWLPSVGHREAGWFEPTEDVEAPRALLEFDQVGEGMRRPLVGLAEAGAVEGDEAVAFGVWQRPEHDAVNHGVDGGGRTDTDGEGHDGERGDGAGAPPGVPRLRDGRQHAQTLPFGAEWRQLHCRG